MITINIGKEEKEEQCNSCISKTIKYDQELKDFVINLAETVQEIGKTDKEIQYNPGAITALALNKYFEEKASQEGRRKLRKTSKKTSKKRKTSRRKGRK